MDALSEANGTFAIQLLKILCQDNPSHNVFYSPVSISSALAMVFLGARGNTAAQMAQVLSLSTEKDIHQNFQSLLAEVNKPGTKYLLRTANRLFGEKTCEFLPTFKESCLRFYHAELEQLSFANAVEQCRKHINTWVSKKTEEWCVLILARTINDVRTIQDPLHQLYLVPLGTLLFLSISQTIENKSLSLLRELAVIATISSWNICYLCHLEAGN